MRNRTDIRVVQEGYRAPASLAFCIANPDGVWLKYVPKDKGELLNIDLDTSVNSVQEKENGNDK